MIRISVNSVMPIKQGAYFIAQQWERQAKLAWRLAQASVPVKTGRLKKSHRLAIRSRAGGFTIVTNTPYDVFVHDGTSKMAGRPWLEQAVREAAIKINARLPLYWISIEKDI